MDPKNIRLSLKDLLWSNALAYFVLPSVAQKKSFMRMPL